jgi:hypothetical protein
MHCRPRQDRTNARGDKSSRHWRHNSSRVGHLWSLTLIGHLLAFRDGRKGFILQQVRPLEGGTPGVVWSRGGGGGQIWSSTPIRLARISRRDSLDSAGPVTPAIGLTVVAGSRRNPLPATTDM